LGSEERMIQANLLTTFHGVGQGLFCSNQFKFSDLKTGKTYQFSFVYDCGTSSAKKLLEKNINEFWEVQRYISRSDDFIDLFVLSHFHSDHFNGLKFLLDGDKRIKVAVIPYLDPIERLLVVLDEWLNLSGVISDDELLEIIGFILKPEDFFEEKSEILLLLKANDEIKDFEERRIEVERDLDRDFVDEIRYYLKIGWNEKKKKINVPFSVRRFGLWQLDFFYPRNEDLISNTRRLKEELRKENVDVNKIEAVEIDIKKEKTGRNIEDSNVNFVFKTSSFPSDLCSISLGKLKDLLKKAGINSKQRNHSSIVCRHFPIDLWKRKNYIKSYKFKMIGKRLCGAAFFHFDRNMMNIRRDAMAQVYTGDIPFNLLKKMMNVLTRKKSYCLFQVPHHGSGGEYWNFQIVNQIRSWYWIVSAGVKNRYGHPSIDVIRDIYNRFGIPIWVNEYISFSLDTIVEWKIKS